MSLPPPLPIPGPLPSDPPPLALASVGPARSGLRRGYRWVLAVGWLVVTVATATVARSTVRMGDPVPWLDWWYLLAVPPIAVLAAVVLDLPRPLTLSGIAAVELLAIAAVDLAGGRWYVGGAELGLGVSAVLLTLACTAGRFGRTVTPAS